VEINSSQGVYKITGKDSEDFPETPLLQSKQQLKIQGADFINIIEKTGYAASKDDLKPALCGVYFSVDEKKNNSSCYRWTQTS
jgi:DNA polymerase-3 subunit beta